MNDDQPRTPSGDEADRLIDEALRALTAGPARDLRADVLARLDQEPARRFTAWGLVPSPAFASAVLLGVAIAAGTWLWTSTREVRPLAGPGAGAAAQPASRPAPSLARHVAPPEAQSIPVGDLRAHATPARMAPLGAGRPSAATALGAGSAWASADLVVDLDESPGPHLPGAPVGDLGEPIAPLPRPQPISIRPITPLPIVTAPPVSDMAAPVSALSDDLIARDWLLPGKSGGSHP